MWEVLLIMLQQKQEGDGCTTSPSSGQGGPHWLRGPGQPRTGWPCLDLLWAMRDTLTLVSSVLPKHQNRISAGLKWQCPEGHDIIKNFENRALSNIGELLFQTGVSALSIDPLTCPIPEKYELPIHNTCTIWTLRWMDRVHQRPE